MPVDIVQTNLNGVFQLAGPILVPFIAYQTKVITVPNGATFAPDLRIASEFDLRITGAAWTCTVPILPASLPRGWAATFILHVQNRSGGPITTTFDPIYHQPNWLDPANGDGVIASYHWDDDVQTWYNAFRGTGVPN